MTGTAPLLEATDVSVRFGGLTALSAATIVIEPISIVGLVGPNGAGKSTLFGVLSGVQQNHDGKVMFRGADITRMSAPRRARAGIARTFQQPELFPSLTVREHLALAYRLHHRRQRLWRDVVDGGAWFRRDADEDRQIDGLLARLGITRIATQRVVGLPLGLSRLVEIGRALATSPTALLLDEASSGLDQREREQLADVLRTVPSEFGSSVLIVEHDVDYVFGLSARVYVLDFGSIIASGEPEVVRADPAVRTAYLGDEGEPAGAGSPGTRP